MSDIKINPRQNMTMEQPKQVVRHAYEFKKIIVYVIAAILALLIIVSIFLYSGKDSEIIKAYDLQDGWQAIFLNNGQTYFGQVADINTETVILDKVYYLQNQQSLQSGPQPKEGELALVKLGSEVHGPQNKMIIPKTSISYIENLKDTSAIVRAILKNE